jgi:hypothetical protein
MDTYMSDLAAPFLQAHHDFLAFVECCDDRQWQAIPATEQRSVGLLAYHIARGYSGETRLIKAVVAGQQLPAIYLDADELDGFNAADAQAHYGCTKAETIALLQQNAAATLDYIRGLSAQELTRTAHVPILAPHFGEVVSVRQLVEGLLPAHVRMHLSEMRAATGADAVPVEPYQTAA